MKGAQRELSRDDARSGLFTFFVVLALGSAGLYALIIGERDTNRRFLFVLALFFLPALASIIARRWHDESFEDVSFKFRWQIGGTPLILGWLVPILVCTAAYVPAWAAGLGHFAPPSMEGGSIAGLGAGPVARFILLLLVSTTLVATIYLPVALGQELGWRGFVLIHLIRAQVPYPLVVCGLLWAVWQLPLVLSGDLAPGATPALRALLFSVVLMAYSFVAARLRLESGSIWPAIVFQATWNATIGAFSLATKGMPLWLGVGGVLVAAAIGVAAVLISVGRWRLRSDPSQEPPASFLPLTRLATPPMGDGST